nr:hypothetical protein [Sphingosinicella sp. CPCC 101087]
MPRNIYGLRGSQRKPVSSVRAAPYPIPHGTFRLSGTAFEQRSLRPWGRKLVQRDGSVTIAVQAKEALAGRSSEFFSRYTSVEVRVGGRDGLRQVEDTQGRRPTSRYAASAAACPSLYASAFTGPTARPAPAPDAGRPAGPGAAGSAGHPDLGRNFVLVTPHLVRIDFSIRIDVERREESCCVLLQFRQRHSAA